MYIYTMYIFQNFYGSSVPFLREFLQRVFFCMSAPDSPPNWDARNGVIVNAARNYSKTTTITSFCKCIYIYILEPLLLCFLPKSWWNTHHFHHISLGNFLPRLLWVHPHQLLQSHDAKGYPTSRPELLGIFEEKSYIEISFWRKRWKLTNSKNLSQILQGVGFSMVNWCVLRQVLQFPVEPKLQVLMWRFCDFMPIN